MYLVLSLPWSMYRPLNVYISSGVTFVCELRLSFINITYRRPRHCPNLDRCKVLWKSFASLKRSYIFVTYASHLSMVFATSVFLMIHVNLCWNRGIQPRVQSEISWIGIVLSQCNIPAFRNKQRVEIGPFCIHASKIWANFLQIQKPERTGFYLIIFRVRCY
jgi:hypothetical protein